MSALVFLETEYGEEAAANAARAGIERYFAADGAVEPVAETTFTSPRYANVIRGRGAMALRTLRFWMGDMKFDRALKEWVKKYGSSRTTPDLEAFLGVLRKPSGGIGDVWADEWLRRTDLPEYRVQFTTSSDGDGAVLVTGTLQQGTTLFHNPVELELRIRGGATARIVVTPEGAETPFEATTSGEVESIVVDPRALILSWDK